MLRHVAEATAVVPEGRISPQDTGLWSDAHVDAWRPVTAGLRDWRTQMPVGDTERFEAAAGALLEELGYERALPSPSPAATTRAARLRERFARELAAREQTVPEVFAR